MSCFEPADPSHKEIIRLLGKINLKNRDERIMYKLLDDGLTQYESKTDPGLIENEDDKLEKADSSNIKADQCKCANTINKSVGLKIDERNHKKSECHVYFTMLDDIPPPVYQQTFHQWKAMMDLNFNFWKMRKRKIIYLQPLDDFPDFVNNSTFNVNKKTLNFFELLQLFASVFFDGFEVQLLPTLDTVQNDWKITRRNHKTTGQKQQLVTDVIAYLSKQRPKDGFCMLGLTWTDLYPTPELNFVLGEASMPEYAGAFSFGRYEPKSYKDGVPPPEIERFDGFLIWKMLKVLSHETCHIFGQRHCVHFHCSMNESTSMVQALRQPIFLCPVCLRKLHKVCKFDIKTRYKKLLDIFQAVNAQYPHEYLENAVHWLEDMLVEIEKAETGYM
ncbi:unnamed protein product [Owenia fusiformis]|uniref:Uncharacterized protein n=1 Tax=Owenia fusiformis TaxID=6347 RepID=A0A8J1TYD0_OWEFU|nr:unnamed protein product [Owenia fusiformis]